MIKNLKIATLLPVLSILVLVGCKSDGGNTPKNLQEQRDLMNGKYKPTKEQLDKAMSEVHIPTPGPNEGSRTPGATAPQPKGNN